MEITKVCRRCEEEKPRSEFYPIREKYVSAYCKTCVKLNSKESAARNPEARRESQRRHAKLQRGTAWGRAGQIMEGMVQRSRERKWPRPEFTRQEVFDIISGGKCSRTGLVFQFDSVAGSRNPWTPVPDRIDSSLPYTKSNVQWVCNMYNAAKQSWTDRDVRTMIDAAVAHQQPGDF